MSPESPIVSPNVIQTRIKVARLMLKAGVLTDDGLFLDGTGTANYIDESGINTEGMEAVAGKDAVQRVQD